jgi:hypothetical protein
MHINCCEIFLFLVAVACLIKILKKNASKTCLYLDDFKGDELNGEEEECY